MTEDVRRRAACDRCHSHKIRCPRRAGQEVCDRCLKAQTPCNFSPFRQKKEPEPDFESTETGVSITSPDCHSRVDRGRNGNNTSVTRRKRKRLGPPPPPPDAVAFEENSMLSSTQLDSLNIDSMGIDWTSNSFPFSQDFSQDDIFDDLFLGNQTDYSSLDFGGILPDLYGEPSSKVNPNSTIPYQRELSLPRSVELASGLVINNDSTAIDWNFQNRVTLANNRKGGIHGIDRASARSCIRKLSQLNIDLFEHSNTIPPICIHDPGHDFGNNDFTDGPSDYSQYDPEDTFRMTQALIDIYPSFMAIFLPYRLACQSAQTVTSFEEGVSSTTSQDSPTTSASSFNTPRPPLDDSAILLLFSCHLRLIAIYEELFEHMKFCIQHPGCYKVPKEAMLTMPKLMIGNYAPPPSSSIPMKMVLLIQFASQLSNYATDLASEIQGPSNASSPESSIDGSMRDPTVAMTIATAETVKSRAGNLSHELGALSTRILSMKITS